MVCGNNGNPQDKGICEYGGRDFVFGGNFHYNKDKGVTCSCGNNIFQMVSHLKMIKCLNIALMLQKNIYLIVKG